MRLSAQTNNFPEICGRICPQDRLCEGSCVIEKGFESVTIGAVEKHITETAFENGWVKPPQPVPSAPNRLASSGPGRLALPLPTCCAIAAIRCTIYDRYDRPAGLLIYGIPGFKLEKHVVQRRHKLLEDGGVTFRLNCNVGTDISFDEFARPSMTRC